MPFLLPNQQRQRTEGKLVIRHLVRDFPSLLEVLMSAGTARHVCVLLTKLVLKVWLQRLQDLILFFFFENMSNV